MGSNHQAITARAGIHGGEMDRDVTVKSQPRERVRSNRGQDAVLVRRHRLGWILAG